MSQFDKYTTAEYVEGLRVFLNIKKQGFQREAGLVRDPGTKRKGRLPSYPQEAIKLLEDEVNKKAALCESATTTFGERFRIARDYLGYNDSQVARQLGVSRELVRRWGENIHRPSCVPELAELLQVPLDWLEYGGEEYLPANSHIGVRVGEENLLWREQLFGMTLDVVAELPDDVDVPQAQAYIEDAVFTRYDLAHAARRAGGRWQTVGATLLFSPWIPIKEHGLMRRYWSDEVEAIISEELDLNQTVLAAWEAVKARCEALGLSSEQYPKLISLHKRIEKERTRAETFGVDLNDMIAASVEAYSQHH
ncbi:diguanylate phosphodiesterase [Novimethylophilus kurashikiensis]|uniref:Diguanylate phosphodiesterase n=1 Tax=Novimethylophilus kurashikiensis TaxID=1825523 RepID=A0A2R5F829_9PROT|nr:helix-turn-helix transcriptional regulator [Novimethylophilus kurashikiensis]GBG14376.1 diguanylate phosphodiesterase [Novimethylophilus kurashikiensis]